MDFIIVKVNGVDVSGLSHESALHAFQTAEEPITVEVLRRCEDETTTSIASTTTVASDDSGDSGVSTNGLDEVTQDGEARRLSTSSMLSTVTGSSIGAAGAQMVCASTQTDANADAACSVIGGEMEGEDDVFSGPCSGNSPLFEVPPPPSHVMLNETESPMFLSPSPVNDQEEDDMYRVEYEEAVLRRSSLRDRIGLTLYYGRSDPGVTDVFIGEVEEGSIAHRNGRIREGDQILQINGQEVRSRDEAIRLFTASLSEISLLVCRPQSSQSEESSAEDQRLSEIAERTEDEEEMGDALISLMSRAQLRSNPTSEGACSSQPMGNQDNTDFLEQNPMDSDSRCASVSQNDSSPCSTCQRCSSSDHHTTEKDSVIHQQIQNLNEQMEAILLSVNAQNNNNNEAGNSQKSIGDNSKLLPDSSPQYQLKSSSSVSSNSSATSHRNSPRHMVPRMGTKLRPSANNSQSATNNNGNQVIVDSGNHGCSQGSLSSPVSLTFTSESSEAPDTAYNTAESSRSSITMATENSTFVAPNRHDCHQTRSSSIGSRQRQRESSANEERKNGGMYLQLHQQEKFGGSMLSLCSTSTLTAAAPSVVAPTSVRQRQQRRHGSPIDDHHPVPAVNSLLRSPNVLVNGVSPPPTGHAPVGVDYTSSQNLGQIMAMQQRALAESVRARSHSLGSGAKRAAHGGNHDNTLSNVGPSGVHSNYSASAGGLVAGSGEVNGSQPSMEWVVKVRADGSKHFTRRPARSRALKERQRKVEVERAGVTTDDDAASTVMLGRYARKEERKRHLEKAKDYRRRKEETLRKLVALKEEAAGDGPNIVDLSHRKMMKQRGKDLGFVSVQELLVHGARVDDPSMRSKLLTVTTV